MMMRISTALVLLAALALSACDQPSTPPMPPTPPVPVVPPTPPSPPAVEPLAEEPVAPPPALPAQQPEAVPAVAPKPATSAKVEPARPPAVPQAEVKPQAAKPLPEPSLPPLDLSVPEEVLQAPSVFAEVPTKPLLPPLFNEPDPDSTSFQLHGKLISNERIDSYWESLEGAELHFEFKR